MTRRFLFLLVSMFAFLSCDVFTSSPGDSSFNCSSKNIVQKGERKIGIDIRDITETGNFNQNVELARSLGAEFTSLRVHWSNLDVRHNIFHDTEFGVYLSLLNEYAENTGLKVSLTIGTVDSSGKTMAEHLQSYRFNDPYLIGFFRKDLNELFDRLHPQNIAHIHVGDVIDGYISPSSDEEFWNDYRIFLQEVTTHIHSRNANIKVGFTGSYSGLMQSPDRYKTLLDVVDQIGVTYYPVDSDVKLMEPNILATEFSKFLSTFPDKDVYVQEVGFPSAAENGSSEEQQADFYCAFFTMWDRNIERIKAANFVRLADVSLQQAQQMTPSQSTMSASWVTFFQSLGIRTYSGEGTPKMAYQMFRDKVEERGWELLDASITTLFSKIVGFDMGGQFVPVDEVQLKKYTSPNENIGETDTYGVLVGLLSFTSQQDSLVLSRPDFDDVMLTVEQFLHSDTLWLTPHVIDYFRLDETEYTYAYEYLDYDEDYSNKLTLTLSLRVGTPRSINTTTTVWPIEMSAEGTRNYYNRWTDSLSNEEIQQFATLEAVFDSTMNGIEFVHIEGDKLAAPYYIKEIIGRTNWRPNDLCLTQNVPHFLGFRPFVKLIPKYLLSCISEIQTRYMDSGAIINANISQDTLGGLKSMDGRTYGTRRGTSYSILRIEQD